MGVLAAHRRSQVRPSNHHSAAPWFEPDASSLANTDSISAPDNGAGFGHSIGEIAIFPTFEHIASDDSAWSSPESDEPADQSETVLPESVRAVLQSAGSPLPPDTRAWMESQFGFDFADVQLHTSQNAAESAAEVQARAYTVGTHVVLSQEAPSLESKDGRSLLAHELSHVVQQRSGGMPSALSPAATHEREAEQVERAVRAGATLAPAALSQTPVGLARTPKDPPSEPPPPVHKEILKELNARLEGQKQRAVKILEEEGIPTKAADKAWDKNGKHDVDFLKRQLKRIADDPGSPRQKAAQALIGEIDGTREALKNVNQDHPNHRVAPLERDKPKPNRMDMDASKETKQKPATPAKSTPDKHVPGSPAKSTTPTGSSAPKPSAGARVTGTTTAADPVRKQEFSKALAGHLASSGKSVARFERFTKGISRFLAAKGALDHALSVLSAIQDMTSLLAHGTALPEEQRQADQVLKQSTEATDWAQSAMEDVPLYSWIPFINQAVQLGDAQGLFAIDESLTQLRTPLDQSAVAFRDLAPELAGNAADLKKEQFKQLVEILMPHTDGTASNAMAFALHESLEKLHGAILSASNNYSAAASTLSVLVDELRDLGDSANGAGWDVSQKQAVERYKKEHQKIQ